MAKVLGKRLSGILLRSCRTYDIFTVYPSPLFILTSYHNTCSQSNFCKSHSAAPILLIKTSVGTYINNRRQCSESRKKEECVKIKETKPSLFKRFKQMYRDYWYVLVPVHLVTSAFWFGGFYYMATSGIDIAAFLETLQFNERIVNSVRDSSMGYIAVAYALYKIATPARYAVTLGGTTISIQYLTKWGYIKPVPSKERLVEMYHETKEGIKEKKENIIESVKDIKERKDNLMESVRETKEGIKEKRDNLIETVKETKETLRHPKKFIDSIKSKIFSGIKNKTKM